MKGTPSKALKCSLDHINMSVKNFEETLNWYKQVFDFELVEEGFQPSDKEGDSPLPWGVIRNGDALLCIYEAPKLSIVTTKAVCNASLDGVKIYHFAFRLKNETIWIEKLNQFRLETYFDSPVRYPHSTSWYVKDPNEYMIEVVFWDEDKIQFSLDRIP